MALVRAHLLEEPLAETAAPWLSAEDQEHLAGLRLDKRRREWVGGRIAAKACLLADRISQRPDRITILADRHGRPVPHGPAAAGRRRLSISHSHGLAVAMTHTHPCGVDIQRVEDRITAMAGRIADNNEQELVAACTAISASLNLTMIWSAKEAVKKQWLPERPGFLDVVRIESARLLDNTIRLGCRTCTGRLQTVRLRLLEGNVLAWCPEE